MLNELAQLVPLLRDRVAASLMFESDSLSGIPTTNTDRAVETVLNVMKEYTEAAQLVGILPKDDVPIIPLSVENNVLKVESMGDLMRLLEVANRSHDDYRTGIGRGGSPETADQGQPGAAHGLGVQLAASQASSGVDRGPGEYRDL